MACGEGADAVIGCDVCNGTGSLSNGRGLSVCPRGCVHLPEREALRQTVEALRDVREALREAVGEKVRLRNAVGKILERNGCDCECDHTHEEHDATCERCLACRISDALG
jgi:hypothetical protein